MKPKRTEYFAAIAINIKRYLSQSQKQIILLNSIMKR